MNYFDAKAAEWDNNPKRRELIRSIAAAIKKAVPLSKTMSAMEFGCGTGLLSHELLPMIDCPERGLGPSRRGNITASDLSPGMIEQLQKRIEKEEIENIIACCLDIFKNPPDEKYDLIFSAMALHHVPDTDALLDRFAELLAPGGWIALADLDTEDGTFHDEDSGPVHHGFEREELMHKLRARGFCETAAVTAHIMQKPSGSYPVFLITARKAG